MKFGISNLENLYLNYIKKKKKFRMTYNQKIWNQKPKKGIKFENLNSGIFPGIGFPLKIKMKLRYLKVLVQTSE